MLQPAEGMIGGKKARMASNVLTSDSRAPAPLVRNAQGAADCWNGAPHPVMACGLATDARLNGPTEVAVDNNDLFIVDQQNSRIRRVH